MRSPSRPIPILLVEGRGALLMSQGKAAEVMGSSRRTVQRWEMGRSSPLPSHLADLAKRVYPHDAALAAEIAAAAHESLVSLGLVAPAPPAPPPPPPVPRHLVVDAVVCAAADSTDAAPSAVRALLLAAFRRARELGLSIAEMETALEARLSSSAAPAPPAKA